MAELYPTLILACCIPSGAPVAYKREERWSATILMRLIFISIILIALVLGPQLWVWWVFRQYRQPRENFPGTGGELARHLLNRFGLQEVRVEPTPMGDHYNPETK